MRIESTRTKALKRIEGSHTTIRSAGDVIRQRCMGVINNSTCLKRTQLVDVRVKRKGSVMLNVWFYKIPDG